MLLTEVFKLALTTFKANIEPDCESFVDLAIDADVINEPLTNAISVNLSDIEALNVFRFDTEILILADVNSILLNLADCVSFTFLDIDADSIKLPVTIPISKNFTFDDAVNVFKLADAVSIICNLELLDPLNDSNELIRSLSVRNTVETEELNSDIFPIKLRIRFPLELSKYSVELPLA